MYASGCRQGQATTGTIGVYKGSTYIDGTTFTDQLGYGYVYFQSLAAGTYTLKFKPTWTSYDVKDYTVSVYSAKQVLIYDDKGQTSNDSQNLVNSMNTAMNSLSSFPYFNGGWYSVR